MREQGSSTSEDRVVPQRHALGEQLERLDLCGKESKRAEEG